MNLHIPTLIAFCDMLEKRAEQHKNKFPTGLPNWRRGRALFEAYRELKADLDLPVTEFTKDQS